MDEIQSVQEPVAWMFQHEETGRTMCVDAQQVEWGFEKGNPRLKKIAPLYTTPPKREWVSLTPKQIKECVENSYFHTAWSSEIDVEMLVNNIDAALQKLNT